MKDYLQKRIESKRKQYEDKQEWFRNLVKWEMNTSCFERNAIVELQSMLELKSEIRELEMIVERL